MVWMVSLKTKDKIGRISPVLGPKTKPSHLERVLCARAMKRYEQRYALS
jgi:rRNA processing protein Gar1